jgi:hypothetical protein
MTRRVIFPDIGFRFDDDTGDAPATFGTHQHFANQISRDIEGRTVVEVGGKNAQEQIKLEVRSQKLEVRKSHPSLFPIPSSLYL